MTPLDFIDLIISRLPIINKNCNDIDPEKIRKHAQAFISLAVRGKWNLTFFFSYFIRVLFIHFKHKKNPLILFECYEIIEDANRINRCIHSKHNP